MCDIEALIVLPVAPLNLAIVPWSKRPDELVADAMSLQMNLEQSWFILGGSEAVGKLRIVVRLDALYRKRECLIRCSTNMAEE